MKQEEKCTHNPLLYVERIKHQGQMTYLGSLSELLVEQEINPDFLKVQAARSPFSN